MVAELRIKPTLGEVVYYYVGTYLWAVGRKILALECFRQAVDSIEDVRHGILKEDTKLPYLGARAQIYDFAVLTALESSAETAFEFAERSRSRAFLDIVSERATVRIGEADATTANNTDGAVGTVFIDMGCVGAE